MADEESEWRPERSSFKRASRTSRYSARSVGSVGTGPLSIRASQRWSQRLIPELPLEEAPRAAWWNELLESYDWWSCWTGLTYVSISTFVVGVFQPPASPEPGKWESNPGDAIPMSTVGGLLWVIPFIAISTNIQDKVTKWRKSLLKVEATPLVGKGSGPPEDVQPEEVICEEASVWNVESWPGWLVWTTSYAFSVVLSLLSLWVGKQVDLYKYGFGYAFWSVFLGIVVTNLARHGGHLVAAEWMLECHAGKSDSYYVKVALVLLGIRLQTIGELGGSGLLVSWCVTPFVVLFIYLFAVWWGFTGPPIQSGLDATSPVPNSKQQGSRTLALIMAVGTAVCGPSASTAAAEVVGATQHELALVVAIMTLWTIAHMIFMPQIANGLNMNEDVAGAWFGGTIDETAAVAGAAAAVSERAEDVGVLVKIIQNSQLGLIVIAAAMWWATHHNFGQSRAERHKSWGSMLWSSFPKFMVGFLIASAYYTIVLDNAMSEEHVTSVLAFAKAGNHWYFTLFFLGIGMKVNLAHMMEDMKGGKIIGLYVIGQAFDLLLTLGVAYLTFSGEFITLPKI